jgi:hypothetical protein
MAPRQLHPLVGLHRAQGPLPETWVACTCRRDDCPARKPEWVGGDGTAPSARARTPKRERRELRQDAWQFGRQSTPCGLHDNARWRYREAGDRTCSEPRGGENQLPQHRVSPTLELSCEAPKFAMLRQLQLLVLRHRVLEVTRRQSCALRDASQHAGANLLALMKREDEIRPAWPREGPMRAGLTLDDPADAQQRRKDLLGPTAGPVAHAARKEISRSWGPASP